MDDYRRRLNPSPPATPPQHAVPMGTPLPPEAPSPRKVVLSLLFFCGSSLGAIFVNKACLTHFKFAFPSSLMVLQAGLTVLLLSLVARVRPQLVSIAPIKPADYSRILPSTIFFIANVTVGLSALSRVNIPMFSAFRRLTVLFVMGAEYIMLKKTHPPAVICSVFVLTFGAFVSALGDVTFTLTGYALVFANNALTAAYLASIKRIMRDLSLDPISLLYYSNVLGFPIILAIAILTGDLQRAVAFYYATPLLRSSPWFVPALSFVAASAFCVNLSTSICTHVTSPLTTSVAGQVKNVLQSLLGFFSWGYIPTPLNVLGLLVALGGQVAFGACKYHDTRKILKDGMQSGPSNPKDSADPIMLGNAGLASPAGRQARVQAQQAKSKAPQARGSVKQAKSGAQPPNPDSINQANRDAKQDGKLASPGSNISRSSSNHATTGT